MVYLGTTMLLVELRGQGGGREGDKEVEREREKWDKKLWVWKMSDESER